MSRVDRFFWGRGRQAGALVAASLALAMWVAPGSASAQSAQPLEGSFVHVGGDRERTRLVQAIDVVVGSMSSIVRGIARRRLVERVVIAPRVEIEHRGASLLLVHEPLPPRPVTAEGGRVRLTSRFGERVAVTARCHERSIVETIRHQGNRRQNTYRLSADGQRLILGVDIRSPLLPRPLRFSLTYARR